MFIFNIFISILFINNCNCDVFHIKSLVSFQPNVVSDYFGYSVVLNNSELYIGAPKAKNRFNSNVTSGAVFKCGLTELNVKNVTCRPLGIDDGAQEITFSKMASYSYFFREDMWFGATISTVPTGKLLVCAPRWAVPYKTTHLLANGACYIQGQFRAATLFPLKEMNRQAFMTDGLRKEFGEYGTHLNFYAYGQAGISVKDTGNNSFIMGAPGLLQWTGGIVEYKYIPDMRSTFVNKQPTANPYYTREIGPDDYLGYSVESGVFETDGKILYIAGAPRSKSGYGQVLIFEPVSRETDSLHIKAKLFGPQLGSYFGATLCCTDINGDGLADLLVGAPNYVRKNGTLTYNQGAVFVYLSEKQFQDNITLKSSGFVMGSGGNGAHFGLSIADLGDIDDDGYTDIAIGAPWEDDGSGSVYIYRGSKSGLQGQYVQKIKIPGSRSFGFSISKGIDVDNNNCNDLAIGAYKSNTAYLFRCVPTVHVEASIKVPDAMDLQPNATNFTALFCVIAADSVTPHVKLDLLASISIDSEDNRAMLDGDSEYNITIKPGNELCEEQVVKVHPTADLSKPISMKFNLTAIDAFQDNIVFPSHAARLSDESILDTSFNIQLTRDCGDDLICQPLLLMTLESLNNPYIPGSTDRLGLKISIINREEASYGAEIHLQLISPPKRLPSACYLEHFNVTCKLPSPFYRGESIEWVIEVEYSREIMVNEEIGVEVELHVPFYRGTNMERVVKQLTIFVTPKASFAVSGKPLPNATMSVTRDKFNERGQVHFEHYFEITNFGPSDWFNLSGQIVLPDKVNVSNKIKGCSEGPTIQCVWSIPAKVSLPIPVFLFYDLDKFGKFLGEQITLNITTTLLLLDGQNKNATITTTLVLEPAQPIWPIIVGCVAGLLLLAVIVSVMYKYGFFSRQKRDDLKRLQEESCSEETNQACRSSVAEESTAELISDSE
ncbi:integrin alpha-V-like [Colias croceus]|uniref:integrin alpha-V-like n=1 Tax=Colias crocea TaxID=72248 RepID=UPI001E27B437|nr:integrin alpha-V-like [Colias croceus]